jgi:hypothetical protein
MGNIKDKEPNLAVVGHDLEETVTSIRKSNMGAI